MKHLSHYLLFLLIFSLQHPARAAAPVAGVQYAVTVYGVASDGKLYWYNHFGHDTGERNWSTRKEIGSGWNFRQVFSGGGGILYAAGADGKLRWYKHKGQADGTAQWEGPKVVGTGWNFRQVFWGGEGILYAITESGDLMWYKHKGFRTGSVEWEGPKKIGSGWFFQHVVSMGYGVFYAVNDKGELFWYKNDYYYRGDQGWKTPVKLADGWNFKQLFPGKDGVLYAVKTNGDMVWYRRREYESGGAGLEGPRVISNGWGGFRQVFVGDVNKIRYGPPYWTCNAWGQKTFGVCETRQSCNMNSGAVSVFAAALAGGGAAEAHQQISVLVPRAAKVKVHAVARYTGAVNTFGYGCFGSSAKTWEIDGNTRREDINPAFDFDDVSGKIIDIVLLYTPGSKTLAEAAEWFGRMYDIYQLNEALKNLEDAKRLKTAVYDFSFDAGEYTSHRIGVGFRVDASGAVTGKADAVVVGKVESLELTFYY